MRFKGLLWITNLTLHLLNVTIILLIYLILINNGNLIGTCLLSQSYTTIAKRMEQKNDCQKEVIIHVKKNKILNCIK